VIDSTPSLDRVQECIEDAIGQKRAKAAAK
jgi:hypothetical protein